VINSGGGNGGPKGGQGGGGGKGGGKKPKAICWWGAQCYQKNPMHLKKYSHDVPKDDEQKQKVDDSKNTKGNEQLQKQQSVTEEQLGNYFDLSYMGDSATEDEGQGEWGFAASDKEKEEGKESAGGNVPEVVKIAVSKKEWETFLESCAKSGLTVPKFDLHASKKKRKGT